MFVNKYRTKLLANTESIRGIAFLPANLMEYHLCGQNKTERESRRFFKYFLRHTLSFCININSIAKSIYRQWQYYFYCSSESLPQSSSFSSLALVSGGSFSFFSAQFLFFQFLWIENEAVCADFCADCESFRGSLEDGIGYWNQDPFVVHRRACDRSRHSNLSHSLPVSYHPLGELIENWLLYRSSIFQEEDGSNPDLFGRLQVFKDLN